MQIFIKYPIIMSGMLNMSCAMNMSYSCLYILYYKNFNNRILSDLIELFSKKYGFDVYKTN